MKKTIKVAVTLLAFSVILNILSAQTFILNPVPLNQPQMSFRYLRPAFEGDEDLTLMSGIYELSLNIPVGKRTNFIGIVPYSTYDLDIEGVDTESGFGNIFVGMQMHSARVRGRRTAMTLGVYLPTASEDNFDANFMSMLTNITEMQKYMPDNLTVLANYAYHQITPGRILFGFEIGPSFWIPTKDNGADTELLLHFGGKFGFMLRRVALFAEYKTMGIITEDYDSLNDRFDSALAFGAQWMGPKFRPGVFYKIYFDEWLTDMIDGVFGIKINFGLGAR